MNRAAKRKSKTVETVVTFLEMIEEPRLHVPPPANMKLMLLRAEAPTVHFYRYLYENVGGEHHWIDRKSLSDQVLGNLIQADETEIFVLYSGGIPAGFFEIVRRDNEDTELRYFGLIKEFRGRGVGKWLLAEALRTCWSLHPTRVRVETCTLDSPLALPLYQKMGFKPYARKRKLMRLVWLLVSEGSG